MNKDGKVLVLTLKSKIILKEFDPYLRDDIRLHLTGEDLFEKGE